MEALSLLASNAPYQTEQTLPELAAIETKEEDKPFYCICHTTYDQGFMICCDVCGLWCHGSCVGVDELHTKESDNFVCPKCTPKQKKNNSRLSPQSDPSRRSSARKRKVHNYSELNDGIGGSVKQLKAATNFKVIMQEKIFSSDDIVRKMHGYELTKEFLASEGFCCPTLVEDKTELQMVMPLPSFTVNDVRNLVGESRVLDVIECGTQAEMIPQWNLGEWADYYTSPTRSRILNVISLEVTNTKLQDEIYSPKIVRDIDWIDTVWPADSMTWPKVQNYCLMSVRGAYTDFHIDFGGSSVWYHVLKGQKLFFFIPPTEENLTKYADWSTSPDQNDIFFADKVDKCYLTLLNPGQTLFIPTGWIHAVYTPEDSLVFGGNFLHGYNIRLQIRIYDIENQTGVPPKFRFPLYENMLWYAADKYYNMIKDGIELSAREIDGLQCLAMTLSTWISKTSAKEIKEFVPETILDPKLLIDNLTSAISNLNMPTFQEDVKVWETNAEANPKSKVQQTILKLLEKQEAMRPPPPNLKITLRLRKDPDEEDESDDELDDGALEAFDEDVYVPSRRYDTSSYDPDDYHPRRDAQRKEKPKVRKPKKITKIKLKVNDNGNGHTPQAPSPNANVSPTNPSPSSATPLSPMKTGRGAAPKPPKPTSVRERLANKLKPGRGR